MYDYKKSRISLDDIEERLLQNRFLLLINTSEDNYVALRVQRQHMSKIAYDFVKDAGLLPLDAVGGTGTSGVTQNAFSQHVAVAINELSINDGLDIPKPRTNNLMQIFYGISPSYLFVSPEMPGGTLLGQMPETSEYTQSTYPYIFDHSGYDSPFYVPSKYTEIFSIANVTIQFTLANTASIPITPRFLLILNNLIVEPVDSLKQFQDMLKGTIPRRVVTAGQIYSTITWSPSVYSNVKPVSASNILGSNAQAAFTKAGYTEGGS